MSRLASQAEVLKLARLLGTEPDTLGFLESQDATAIRALRERMTGVLYDDGKHLLQKVAAATKLTPTGISAVIAEKALGPLLCARVASLLGAGSRIVILPIQDIFGSKDRINTPGTLGDHNWTYRFPAPAEDFLKKHGDAARAFAALVRENRS